MAQTIVDPWKGQREVTPAPATRTTTSGYSGGGGGGLLSLLGGQGGESSSLPRLGLLGGDEGGMGDSLARLGAILMMMNPNTQNAGAAMMQLQGQRGERREKAKRRNETAAWLGEQGMGANEAAFLAANPEALNAWYKEWKEGDQPDWQFQTLPEEDGSGEAQWMVDMNNPTRRQKVGGVKKYDDQSKAPTVHTFYEDGKPVEKQWNPDTGGWDAIGAGKPEKVEAPARETFYNPETKQNEIRERQDDGSWKTVGIASPEEVKPPDTKEFWNEKEGKIDIKQFNPATGEYDKVIGQGKPPSGMSVTVGKDGEVTYTVGTSGGAKGPTNEEKKAGGFATRAANAEKGLTQYESSLTGAWDNVAGAFPGGRYLQSEEFQLGQQAGKEWLTAVLRGDSGGTITADETSEYGSIYLPQPGDKPKMAAARRAARDAVMRGLQAGQSPEQALAANRPQVVPEEEPPAPTEAPAPAPPPAAAEPAVTPPPATSATPAIVGPAAAAEMPDPMAGRMGGEAAAPNILADRLRQSMPGIPRIRGDEDYAKLPPGSPFVGPDGVLRIKPK